LQPAGLPRYKRSRRAVAQDSFAMAMNFAPQDADEFAALLAESAAPARTRFKPGDRVRGQVLFLGENNATLLLPDGQEGLLDLSGLRGKDGQPTVKEGDSVEGHVVRIRDRVIEVARHLGRGTVNMDVLHEAAQSGLPISGTISATNKGGYVIDLGNGAQGFCPHAMVDVRRVEDPNTLVGQRFEFRVLEIRDQKDVLLSRRAVLQEAQERNIETTRAALVVGARLKGTVTNVREFGAFVDLGGIEGMIPASELAYGRVKVEEVVHPGEKVEVEVMRVEPSVDNRGRPNLRISLSMRALTADPFEAALPALLPGVVLEGKVRRTEVFGAFVELVPGVEGLVHVSAFGRRVIRPSDVVQPEQRVTVRILAVDAAARRVSLAYVAPENLIKILDPNAKKPSDTAGLRIVGVALPLEDRGAAEGLQSAPNNQRAERARVPGMGEVLTVTVDKHESFGVFVTWGTPPQLGRGLVPVSELGLATGADTRRNLPVGSTFEAVVLDSRPDGKVRLSKAAAIHAREQNEANDWLKQQTGAAASLGRKKGA
jgi:small subunit ribosomal protein S1